MNMNTVNALVYCENSNLYIRKPNGLEYQFDNVDAPALGFDFDVLIYEDGLETKVIKWDDSKPLQEQEQFPLSDNEKDMIETYIANSEPPEGITLQRQYVEKLEQVADDYVNIYMSQHNFRDLNKVVAIGREGSNHPNRSDARRVLEYFDAVYTVFIQVADEIYSCREDMLKEFREYEVLLPTIVNQYE